MATEPTPGDAELQPGKLAIDARGELQRARVAMEAATGGVAPARVLTELAHALASELAQHFDELPMRAFGGYVRRDHGALAWLGVPRRVPHRVVMGRYLDLSFPKRVAEGWNRQSAHIAVLALGADGVLRVGATRTFVRIPQDNPVKDGAKPWDHLHLRRVPTSALMLRRWTGDPEPRQVARPRDVIDVLAGIAAAMTAEIGKDLDVMRRFGVIEG